MSNLTVRSIKPEKKITATWSDVEKKIIEFQLYKNVVKKEGDVDTNTAEELEVLAECKYKKIEDYKNGDFQELDKTLLQKQKFVGAEEPMSDDDMDVMIEFMQDEFPEFSISEINLAFSLAISGKLPIGRIEDVRFFSPVFIAKILNAYREKRNEIIIKYRRGEDDVARELIDQSRKEDAEKNQDIIMRNVCLGAFKNFKEGVPFLGITPIYNFLTKEGIIALTNERIKDFDKKAAQSLELRKFKDKDLRTIINNADTAPEKYNMFKQDEQHTMIVRDFFAGLVEMEQELHELFEKKQVKKKVQKPLIDTKVKANRKKN